MVVGRTTVFLPAGSAAKLEARELGLATARNKKEAEAVAAAARARAENVFAGLKNAAANTDSDTDGRVQRVMEVALAPNMPMPLEDNSISRHARLSLSTSSITSTPAPSSARARRRAKDLDDQDDQMQTPTGSSTPRYDRPSPALTWGGGPNFDHADLSFVSVVGDETIFHNDGVQQATANRALLAELEQVRTSLSDAEQALTASTARCEYFAAKVQNAE